MKEKDEGPEVESSHDESDYSIQDSDKEFQLSTDSEEGPYDVDKPSPPSCLQVGDYAVVRVERKQKTSFQLYEEQTFNTCFVQIFKKFS